jgi:hypothetical protein
MLKLLSPTLWMDVSGAKWITLLGFGFTTTGVFLGDLTTSRIFFTFSDMLTQSILCLLLLSNLRKNWCIKDRLAV